MQRKVMLGGVIKIHMLMRQWGQGPEAGSQHPRIEKLTVKSLPVIGHDDVSVIGKDVMGGSHQGGVVRGIIPMLGVVQDRDDLGSLPAQLLVPEAEAVAEVPLQVGALDVEHHDPRLLRRTVHASPFVGRSLRVAGAGLGAIAAPLAPCKSAKLV